MQARSLQCSSIADVAGRVAGDLIPQPDAARLQAAMIPGDAPDDHLLELRVFQNGPCGSEWFGVRDYAACAERAIKLAERGDVYIGAAPRVRQRGRAEDVERIWALWADCDTPESVEALRRFRPLPNIVNRSGTAGRLHAWWQIPAGMTPAQAVRANRRLALALGADRASTDAARIMRLAGTSNWKTSRPLPVECVRLELDGYTVADVVGGLPDPDERRPASIMRPQATGAPDAALDGVLRTVREAQAGDRNATLYWAACRLVEHGWQDAEVSLREAALAAGLPEREVDRTIASALDRRAAA